MSSAAPNDKTANKVALCSAIFAGFAYVGYSVVRTAFGKKGKRDHDGYGDPEHRIYFRRLSQTTQTDVLLGNLDTSGSGKVMLRSITVQERIRELNLRARMFADTMLAIQGSSRLSNPRRVVAKSLQGSPWSSPRILSPVDVQRIINSRSSENLHMMEGDIGCHSSSPVRRRWVRRSSFRRKSPAAAKNRSNSKDNDFVKHEQAAADAKKLLKHEAADVKRRLQALVNRRTGTLTSYEAKALVALLHIKDVDLLEKALITIGNQGTFEENQNTLREAGCLVLLSKLISHSDENVRLSAIAAFGNLALNKENQVELQCGIPTLIQMLKKGNASEELTLHILTALSNFAVLSDWHFEFCSILRTAYQLVDKGSPVVKLQSLKLLINLSCNEDMVPSLLAAQAPRRLIYLLDTSTNEDILLRVVTLLTNLVQTAKVLQIDPAVDLPAEDKAASPDTMYAAIFGVNAEDKLLSKLSCLMNKHQNEDIRLQCRRVIDALT